MSLAAPAAPPAEPPPTEPPPIAAATAPRVDRDDPPGIRLLDRFLWLVARDVDEEAAMGLMLTPEESARMDELAAADRAGTLQPEDVAELGAFENVNQFASLLKIAVDRKRRGWQGPDE